LGTSFTHNFISYRLLVFCLGSFGLLKSFFQVTPPINLFLWPRKQARARRHSVHLSTMIVSMCPTESPTTYQYDPEGDFARHDGSVHCNISLEAIDGSIRKKHSTGFYFTINIQYSTCRHSFYFGLFFSGVHRYTKSDSRMDSSGATPTGQFSFL